SLAHDQRNPLFHVSSVIRIPINSSTTVAPGAKLNVPAATSPANTAASEKTIAQTNVFLKLRAMSRLAATGIVSSAETSSAPTILIATEMTSAVRTVKVTFNRR